MSYEDRVSSCGYSDEVSLSRFPFVNHKFPGRTRMCYDNVMLPVGWIEREKVRCCYDERYSERVVELFTLRERERERDNII